MVGLFDNSLQLILNVGGALLRIFGDDMELEAYTSQSLEQGIVQVHCNALSFLFLRACFKNGKESIISKLLMLYSIGLVL